MADETIFRGPTVEVRGPPRSLAEELHRRLGKHGHAPAQLQEVEGGRVVTNSFSQLLTKGHGVAALLRERSINPGDTVMLCCGNTLDFAPVMLGTLFLGATLAPVNPLFDPSDMQHLLGVVQPSLVICNPASQAAVASAIASSGRDIPWVPLDAIIKALDGKQVGAREGQLGGVDSAADVAFVMCSSGTTGKPKGVEILHDRFCRLIEKNVYSRGGGASEAGTVVLNMSGPNWVSCLLATCTTLWHGHPLVLLEGCTPQRFLHAVQTFRVGWTIISPDLVVMLVKNASLLARSDTTSLRNVLVGGAAVPDHLFEELNTKLGGCMVQIYGMTEMMGVARPDYRAPGKVGNVGKLMVNCEAKVLDVESGELLCRGKQGELCFRTPTTMKGYRGDPVSTSAAVDPDGFLHTGDVGYFDDDGFLFIKDRVKDLIKYRRDHVPPIDIEEVLLTHPAVEEAAVVGVFHEEDWERATGAVVLRKGASASQAELIRLVQEELPPLKWLHGGVRFMERLPRTSSGKVQRRAVRDAISSQ